MYHRWNILYLSLVVTLQDRIDAIAYSSASAEDIIARLRDLFETEGIRAFCDLDDTLTDQSCCFYSKVRILWRVLSDTVAFPRILSDFRVNPDFLRDAEREGQSRFVIISRNDHRFVIAFITYTRTFFAEHGVELLAGVGRHSGFSFSSADKLRMIPNDSVLFSDMFEYSALSWDRRFRCVDRYDPVRLRWCQIRKIVRLMWYFICFLFSSLWR